MRTVLTISFLLCTVGCHPGEQETASTTEKSQAFEGGCTPGDQAACSWMGICDDSGTTCLCYEADHRLGSERCAIWHATLPQEPVPAVTMTPLPVGDATCEEGGTRFSVEGQDDAYACNGASGAQGPVGPEGPPGADGALADVLWSQDESNHVIEGSEGWGFVGAISVAPGSYVVSAQTHLVFVDTPDHGPGGWSPGCELRLGATGESLQEAVYGIRSIPVEVGGTLVPTHKLPIHLSSPVVTDVTTDVELWCRGNDVEVVTPTLAAMEVGQVTSVSF